MAENKFQADLIKELKTRFPGCLILKNDPNYIQGIPDLLMLYGSTWCAFECKDGAHAKHQPNQDYYIAKLDGMSFARFIFPENKEEVLDEVQRTLRSQG